MFGMIPFERNNDNFFDIFDNFERKFFGNSSAALPDFRTDIRDAGDKFVLEAELPGFQKEDIKLDVKDPHHLRRAQREQGRKERAGRLYPQGAPLWVLPPFLRHQRCG